LSTSATEPLPLLGRILVALRGLALRWRLPLLWSWIAGFPFLVWLYWSPETSPPTAIGEWEVGLDKPVHAATHGFMVVIPALLVTGRWRALAIGAGLTTAIALEFGQLFVPGRSFEWLDIIANTTGAALGWYVAVRLRTL
jgi:hypothetical protein